MLYRQLENIIFTPNHYISGMHAMNIHDNNHHTGDWHTLEFWGNNARLMKYSLMGIGEKYNTNAYLGSIGIISAADILRKMGKPVPKLVYAANHPRAIADMIICDAMDGLLFSSVDMYKLDDWMPSRIDKERVYKMLDIAKSKLPIAVDNEVDHFIQTAKNTKLDAL